MVILTVTYPASVLKLSENGLDLLTVYGFKTNLTVRNNESIDVKELKFRLRCLEDVSYSGSSRRRAYM